MFGIDCIVVWGKWIGDYRVFDDWMNFLLDEFVESVISFFVDYEVVVCINNDSI